MLGVRNNLLDVNECLSVVQISSIKQLEYTLNASRPYVARGVLIALPLAETVKGSSAISELMPGRSWESPASCSLLDSELAPDTAGILPTLT